MAAMALQSSGCCYGFGKGTSSCSVTSSSFAGQRMQVFSARKRVSFAPAAFKSVRASTAEALEAPAVKAPTHPSAVSGASPHKAGAFIPAQHRWMYEGIEKRGPDEWNRTWYPKAKDHLNVEKKWYIVDAAGKRLGRLASTIAIHIRGKDLPTYTPSVDMGAYVIVINAEKVGVTGNKRSQKIYRRHSGRPGGMKEETFDQLQKRIPERIVEHAVRGMLPKGRVCCELLVDKC
eukprot:TRINITY_DN581_c0_g1_i3.p1 TRINITY_DN581_c0_g1~~TRINITY_DN581_c0_g1_i3.p1  ORF type:complete len:233 (+),score=25.33 TRINITY_DN581_c0_g1_i3:56-754(+)